MGQKVRFGNLHVPGGVHAGGQGEVIGRDH